MTTFSFFSRFNYSRDTVFSPDKFIVLLMASFVLNQNIGAQTIVNIEQKRIVTDTVGWAGSTSLNYRLNKDVETNYAFTGSVHAQYKTKRNLYLFLSNLTLLEAGEEQFMDAGMIHMRFNRKYGKSVRWELFSQIQYNKLLLVDLRFLLGTGPRLKLLETKNLKLYQGTLYMYEYEEILRHNAIQRDHRLSAYLSGAYAPGDRVSISGTYYFQPKLSAFSDNRSSGQLKIEISLTEKLNFTTTFNYLHDSSPPIGVPKEAYRLTNGLEYTFQ